MSLRDTFRGVDCIRQPRLFGIIRVLELPVANKNMLCHIRVWSGRSLFIVSDTEKHPVIAGAFGAAMVVSFTIWMVAELMKSTTVSEMQTQILELAGSSAMAGFAAFVLVRFFWIRSIRQSTQDSLAAGRNVLPSS
jgi:hypothetical protein